MRIFWPGWFASVDRPALNFSQTSGTPNSIHLVFPFLWAESHWKLYLDAKRASDVILGWSDCNMRVSLFQPFTETQRNKWSAASADHGAALVMRLPDSNQADLLAETAVFFIRHQQKCSEDKRNPWDAADSVWKPSSAPTCFLHFLAFPSRFRQTRTQMMMVFQGNCKLKELLLRLAPSETYQTNPIHQSQERSHDTFLHLVLSSLTLRTQSIQLINENDCWLSGN